MCHLPHPSIIGWSEIADILQVEVVAVVKTGKRTLERWKPEIIAMNQPTPLPQGNIWDRIETWANRITHGRVFVGVFAGVFATVSGVLTTAALCLWQASAMVTGLQSELQEIKATLGNVPDRAAFESFKGEVKTDLATFKGQVNAELAGVKSAPARKALPAGPESTPQGDSDTTGPSGVAAKLGSPE